MPRGGSGHHQLDRRTGGAPWRRGLALTKFGIAAFAESLRQELVPRRVRVSVVMPSTVDTGLVSHVREEIRGAARSQMESIEPLRPEDVGDAVVFLVARDRRVAVNELLVRASEQTW